MYLYLLAALIGVLVGLRTMTAPAAVSWAAYLGLLPLQNTPLAFLGSTATPYVFTVGAVIELIADKLPSTPSRKGAIGFSARLVSGGLCGAAIGATGGVLVVGLVAGVTGAVVGTLGGYAVRMRLAEAMGRDLPAALLEDIVAVGGSVLVMAAFA